MMDHHIRPIALRLGLPNILWNSFRHSASQWAKGAPVKAFLFGTKRPDAQLPVGTFRCSSCGYLEAYARQEFAAT